MSLSKKIGITIFIVIIVLGGLHLGGRRSASVIETVDSFFVSTAEAVVGRPLTPVSVAGVGRRTARRCANGTYKC